jgi:hypothetical protein
MTGAAICTFFFGTDFFLGREADLATVADFAFGFVLSALLGIGDLLNYL